MSLVENEQKDTHEMEIFKKYRVTLQIMNSRKVIEEMVRVVRIGFGCIDVGLYFFRNLTQIHTSGTNGIPMVPAFLTYDLGRNSHENQGVSIGSDHPHRDKSAGDLFEAN
ncbi:hypothetical protein Tco_0987809 [Tanacetum coccineum]